MIPFGVFGAGTVGILGRPSLFSNGRPINDTEDTKEIKVNLHITFDNGLELNGLSADAIVAILRAIGELEPKKENPNG